MKIYIICTVVIGFSLLVFASHAAYSAQTILNIQVDGYIKEPATWVDENNRPISAMTLSFSGYVKPTPSVDVDSQVSRARLINAVTYPVSVELVRPHICSVGNRPVQNQHVYMLVDGVEVPVNTNVSIPDRTMSFSLRFTKRGNYGHLAGSVTCNHRGSLTYTY